MTTNDQQHVASLIEMNLRRLRVLELQQGQFGSLTPPHILIDIEDTQKEIARLKRVQAGEQAIAIELWSFAAAAPRESTAIRIEWASHFQPLPPPEAWHSLFLPHLEQIRQELDAQYPEPIVALRARAHLTLGFMFGYVFRAVTGFRLWIEQSSDGRETQWWRTDDDVGKDLSLQVQSRPHPGEGQDTLVALGISRNVQVGVEQWLQSAAQPIGEVVEIVPRSGISKLSVQDGSQALAMAYQIETALISARDARPSGTIHLVGALPFGLAALIGTRLNRCGPIQLYEYTTPANHYVASWLLT